MLDTLKTAILEALTARYSITAPVQIDRPPAGQGDFAWCATRTAHEHGLSPLQVAKDIASELSRHELIESAVASGPYVNMHVSASVLFKTATTALASGQASVVEPERIMVEYLSPNTNKPLHLGHVRNGVIGSSVANLLEAVGHTVIRANLVNDRGSHICKSMLAYERFGNGQTPLSAGKKGDHFVGDWYVRYAEEEKKHPEVKADIDAMLVQWEAGDPKTIALWETMNAWVYQGFATTYARYGFRFDQMYYESNLYQLGKDLVHEGVARGILATAPDGSIYYPLRVDEFGLDADGNERKGVLLRGDGTSLYLTQDIGTAVIKAEDFDLDRSIYVVMSEQDHHFKMLFSLLQAYGYPWSARCYHLSYEMVELPNGRMKSREGTVVDADTLADEMKALALKAVSEREDAKYSSQAELEGRADIIGLAAIKFFLLRHGARRKVVFNPQKSLTFNGDTGPYCLYAYARTRSILQKADSIVPSATLSTLGTPMEKELARELLEFPSVVLRAAENCNPTLVAESVLAVARAFNRFYKDHPVLTDDANLTADRLALTQATSATLRHGLNILGIETLERM